MRRLLAPLIAAALVSWGAAALAAPTVLVTCGAYGRPLIEAARPGVSSILLDPEGDARYRPSGTPIGSQPLGLVASGNGLVVEADGMHVPIAWICLLEDEDRALFFHWFRTGRASPIEPCRPVSDPREKAACLQGLLDAAEHDLTAVNLRLAPRVIPLVDAGFPRTQPPPKLASDAPWRSYRDAECGRRRDAAVAAGSESSETLLTCLVEHTRHRIDELNGR